MLVLQPNGPSLRCGGSPRATNPSTLTTEPGQRVTGNRQRKSTAPGDIIRIVNDPVSAVGVGKDADEVEADLFVEDISFIHVLLGVFLK